MLLAGCRTLSGLEVPSLPAPKRSFPPPPPAVIRVPVALDLPLQNLTGEGGMPDLSGTLPQKFSKILQYSKGQAVKAWKDPLHLEASRNSLSTLMHIHYRLGEDAVGLAARSAQKVQGLMDPGGVGQEALVKMSTSLKWDPAWHLEAFHSVPGVKGLKSVGEDSRKVGEYLAQRGSDLLVQEGQVFDERLRVLTDIEPKARDVWEQIQDPIYLDKGIWFVLQPKTVSVGPVRLDPRHPQTVQTEFQMIAYPKILFGPKPEPPKSSLPPLMPFQKGPEGFHAVSNIFISYAEAVQLIQDFHMGIVGHVFKETGDRKLKITGLKLYGSGGKVVARVDLQYNPILNLSDKPAEMTVYLLGTLKYRPDARVFTLPDMDYDIKTSDLLVQFGDWIFRSDIRKLLRQKARIPVGPKLDGLRKTLSEALNRPLGERLDLRTDVRDFRVLEAFADNEGMKARVALNGTAALNVQWKKDENPQ